MTRIIQMETDLFDGDGMVLARAELYSNFVYLGWFARRGCGKKTALWDTRDWLYRETSFANGNPLKVFLAKRKTVGSLKWVALHHLGVVVAKYYLERA